MLIRLLGNLCVEQGWQEARAFREAIPFTATRRQEAAHEHQRAEARQGKADRMSGLSVEQNAAHEHPQKRANLGFACFCPKESRA